MDLHTFQTRAYAIDFLFDPLWPYVIPPRRLDTYLGRGNFRFILILNLSVKAVSNLIIVAKPNSIVYLYPILSADVTHVPTLNFEDIASHSWYTLSSSDLGLSRSRYHSSDSLDVAEESSYEECSIQPDSHSKR